MGWVALGGAAVIWTYYLWLIPQERIERRPWGLLVAMALVLVIGLLSGSWAGFGAVVLAGYFWFLILSSGYFPPSGVVVGDEFPSFAGLAASGDSLSSDDWSGRRVLFKLYRGPW